MTKCAIYVAGDRNIIFPSIVTFNTIRKYNKIDADYYICFDGELTEEEERIFKSKDIKHINTQTIGDLKEVLTYNEMKEGAWPKEVLYNWGIPLKLNEFGYKYGIKVDYDLICLSPYDIDIFPKSEIFSAVVSNQLLEKQKVNIKTRIKFKLEQDTIDYFNVGFVIINISEYVRCNFFSELKCIYQWLLENNSNIPSAEQMAIAIVVFSQKLSLKRLPQKYNFTTTNLPIVDKSSCFPIINLHYTTKHKPWKPIDWRDFDIYLNKLGRAHLYFMFDIWRKEMAEDELILSKFSQQPFTNQEWIQIVGLSFKSIYKNSIKSN